jgi:hypothetical protein
MSIGAFYVAIARLAKLEEILLRILRFDPATFDREDGTQETF